MEWPSSVYERLIAGDFDDYQLISLIGEMFDNNDEVEISKLDGDNAQSFIRLIFEVRVYVYPSHN